MANQTMDSDLFINFCQYQKSLHSALSRASSGRCLAETRTRKSFDRAWGELSPTERARWTQKFHQGYQKVAAAQRDEIARVCLTGVEGRANRHAA